ncbi:hypothetical protein J437_LFUL019267 [Ladona fulva]|uniref:DNA-directed DNA polymerase n=1 Tax=Ladona fulva TaxID=123851 RepID=A0A8K0KTI8_LADFU|nr:hypothetical protein J437_LFUL019267 [Ladona fulva]
MLVRETIFEGPVNTSSSPGAKDIFQHIPVLCIIQQACGECWKIQDAHHICSSCGVRQQCFDGSDPVADFFQYLRLPRQNFKHIICIAHNLKGYDGQFVLRHMVCDLKLTPSVLMTGTKMMMLEWESITFKDSLNFLPMSLEKLPKALNAGPGLKKGYFPHFFNSMKNCGYVGALPERKFYGYERMGANEKKSFDEWCDSRKDQPFDLEMEMKEYCENDVTVLRCVCTAFCTLFEKLTNVHPFEESTTIAGSCLRAFKRNFLKKDQIGVIPAGGYRWRDLQSHDAVMWLLGEERRRGIVIKHAGNGSEVRVMGKKVDGFHEAMEGEDAGKSTIFLILWLFLPWLLEVLP